MLRMNRILQVVLVGTTEWRKSKRLEFIWYVIKMNRFYQEAFIRVVENNEKSKDL